MSAAIVTGSYALISSALNYWTTLAQSNGYTADAYLNTPVGTDSLNFGKHAFKNLSAWNTPDGINGILAWTAVPATDANDGSTVSTPPTAPRQHRVPVVRPRLRGQRRRGDRGLRCHQLPRPSTTTGSYIDTNHDGLITAQELTTSSSTPPPWACPKPVPWPPSWAARRPTGRSRPGINNEVFNENPDHPAAEQRRFNFFDYAADGQLNGSITINEFKMLGRTLLPSPDAYTIIDRQRPRPTASCWRPPRPATSSRCSTSHPASSGYPSRRSPSIATSRPTSSPSAADEKGGTYLPVFTLFDPTIESTGNTTSSNPDNQVVGATKSTVVDGAKFTVNYLVNAPTPTPTPSPTPAPRQHRRPRRRRHRRRATA